MKTWKAIAIGLQRECDILRDALAQRDAATGHLRDENKRLKEAIASIPDTASYEWSQHRLRLREAAGLGVKP